MDDMREGFNVGPRVANIIFFQAEDGIRDLVRSRELGNVYKGQSTPIAIRKRGGAIESDQERGHGNGHICCSLYTSDAADDLPRLCPSVRSTPD